MRRRGRLDARGALRVWYPKPHVCVTQVDGHLSLALADNGDLYAGSSGKGQLYKITGPGRATVIGDLPGDEIKAIAVGKARGIVFPPDIIDSTLGMIKGFPPASKSSMLEDLERGRPLELPWLSGAVARLGKEAGVPTPTHHFITTVLMPFASGRR